jgi:hypothetical protein
MEDKKVVSKLRRKLGKQSFVEDLYQQKTIIEDKRFGPVTFWSKKRGRDLLLMKKRYGKSTKECELEILQAKERLKLNHDFLMKMVDYSVKIKSPSHFEIWGFYQAPLQDLKREIDKRVKINRYS